VYSWAIFVSIETWVLSNEARKYLQTIGDPRDCPPAVLGIAIWGYTVSRLIQPLFMFGYIGTSLGLGLGLYGLLPKKQKPIGRRLTLFLIGLFLMGFAVFIGRENIQLEGAIFGLLTGVIHYAVAMIFGTIIFGRMWCGWACWTVMVLDLLPSPPIAIDSSCIL